MKGVGSLDHPKVHPQSLTAHVSELVCSSEKLTFVYHLSDDTSNLWPPDRCVSLFAIFSEALMAFVYLGKYISLKSKRDDNPVIMQKKSLSF